VLAVYFLRFKDDIFIVIHLWSVDVDLGLFDFLAVLLFLNSVLEIDLDSVLFTCL